MGTYFPTLTNMAKILADCPTFRTFVSAADQAAALLKIHYLLHDIDSDEFPFAAVTYMGGGSYQLNRTSEGGGIKSFDNTRSINVVLQDKQEYTAATEQTFMELVSDVVSDICDLSSSTNNYMLIDSITLDDEAVSYVEQSKTYQAIINIEPRS